MGKKRGVTRCEFCGKIIKKSKAVKSEKIIALVDSEGKKEI